MSIFFDNSEGRIRVENDVIARIAGISATECYGIIGMASRNMKDGIVTLLGRENVTKGVKLSLEDEKLTIDLHIIVKYGTNIKTVAETTISTVKYKVEELSGIKVSHINVFVEGIKIKD